MTDEHEAAASQQASESSANTPPQSSEVDQGGVTPEASRDQAAEPAPASDAGAATDATTEAQKPSGRIRIGTQRVGEDAPQAKSAIPAAEPKTSDAPPKKYPPPNIRGQLPPDLEAEFDAVLGGASLNSLMDASTDAANIVELAPETRLQARVSRVHGEHIFLELDGHNQGVLPLKQFEDQPPPEPGAELEVMIIRHNADEGLYELSLPTAAIDVGNWDEVEEGQIVEVAITGSNKGGLECMLAGIRGFIPMGQISIYRVENPEELVGQRFACVITEANRDQKNLVLSHRAVMERERAEKREKLLAELAPGQIREGVVRSLRDFGAFVDLGGIDGLVHVSKMSWDRIGHPSEVLQEGQEVKVQVERVDPESGRISLSYREMGENPWDDVDSKYPAGAVKKGVVSKLMDLGAFVKLEPGVEGLIHVSELAHGRTWRPRDVVSEGQEIDVKILSVDRDKQRISLSVRALSPKPGGAVAKQDDEDMPLPADAPRPPKKQHAANLKGGIGGPSGGDQFGLKW